MACRLGSGHGWNLELSEERRELVRELAGEGSEGADPIGEPITGRGVQHRTPAARGERGESARREPGDRTGQDVTAPRRPESRTPTGREEIPLPVGDPALTGDDGSEPSRQLERRRVRVGLVHVEEDRGLGHVRGEHEATLQPRREVRGVLQGTEGEGVEDHDGVGAKERAHTVEECHGFVRVVEARTEQQTVDVQDVLEATDLVTPDGSAAGLAQPDHAGLGEGDREWGRC